MHAVYHKKLNVALWDYKITTVQTPKIAEYVENGHCFYCFWTRLVLLNGLKLQNTNSTETFLYSRLKVAFKQNNNNSERFFKFTPLSGKCFISSILSKSWWYTFHPQCKPPSSFWPKNLSSNLYFNDSTNFCLSLLLPCSPIEVTFDYTIE